ncbi:hypothetical protein AJ78_05176 [Emergomyces pasteurianus Ep9510]|uniref:DUF3669 domain-containing protein n=1 Tax=Emergomyces pasteurianus Ep9510 TaxID=1447872 RepID=A0A1J9QEX5_9EURO|nr:hypothetical protein AJ78_05176 [Emergomyces pasteurianus Ep9510]
MQPRITTTINTHASDEARLVPSGKNLGQRRRLKQHHLSENYGVTLTSIVESMNSFAGSKKLWPDRPNPGCAAMQMQRILPLPYETRKALIRLYFDPAERERALSSKENKDCLIRVYLGAYAPEEIGDGTWRTSLRNFELYLDMAKNIDLDVVRVAKEMAVSLAIMHWEAMCDGMDTEWVLGSVATSEMVLPDIPDDFQTMSPPYPRCLAEFQKTTYLSMGFGFRQGSAYTIVQVLHPTPPRRGHRQ